MDLADRTIRQYSEVAHQAEIVGLLFKLARVIHLIDLSDDVADWGDVDLAKVRVVAFSDFRGLGLLGLLCFLDLFFFLASSLVLFLGLSSRFFLALAPLAFFALLAVVFANLFNAHIRASLRPLQHSARILEWFKQFSDINLLVWFFDDFDVKKRRDDRGVKEIAQQNGMQRERADKRPPQNPPAGHTREIASHRAFDECRGLLHERDEPAPQFISESN